MRRRDLLLIGVSALALMGMSDNARRLLVLGARPAAVPDTSGPTLDLTLTSAVDPSLTFSRADGPAATFYDIAGTLQYARQNYNTNSSNLSLFNVAGTTVVANSAAAPDATVTATRVVESSATSVHQIFKTTVTGLTAAAVYTASVFVKPQQDTFLQLVYDDAGSNGCYATFTLTGGGSVSGAATARGTGTVTGASITFDAVSGFYRCVLTGSQPLTTARFGLGLSNVAAPGFQPSYTGNTANGLLVWGGQVELGATASTYIPTGAAASGAPRFDYNPSTHAARGLLIEESRTNLCLQSADVSNATWIKTGAGVAAPTVTGNNVASPDGATTASRVVLNTCTIATDVCTVNQAVTASAAPYTFSLWLRGNVGGEQIYLSTSPDNVTFQVQFLNLTTTWTRYWFTTTNLTAAAWTFRVGFDRRDSNQTATIGCTFFMWGAQIELGAFPTSYIPTLAASGVRAADVMTTPVGAWFNASASTIVAEGMFPYAIATTQQGIVLLDDGTSGNRAILRATLAGSGALNANYVAATVSTASATAAAISVGTAFKFGAAMSSTGITVSKDGGAVVTNAGAAPTGITTMRFGQNSLNASFMCGYLTRVRYWRRVITNAELIAATT